MKRKYNELEVEQVQDISWLRSLVDNGLCIYLDVKDILRGIALVNKEAHDLCYHVICEDCPFIGKANRIFSHYKAGYMIYNDTTVIKWPSTIRVLELSNEFNCYVDFNCLPSLTTIFFGEKFDQHVDYLPSSIITIDIWGLFNKRVDHLPPNLKRLCLGHNFQEPVDNLPSTLLYLSIKSPSFNQPLDHLPPSLFTLIIKCDNYFHSLDYLPSSLKDLRFCNTYAGDRDYIPIDHLPSSLVNLKMIAHIGGNIDYLPASLIALKIRHFNSSVDFLPPSLQYLNLGAAFAFPIDHLPDKITHIVLGPSFNQPVDNLPACLRKFYTADIYTETYCVEEAGTFNQPIDHLPPLLSILSLGAQFNHPVDNLPGELESLVLGDKFNQNVDYLPPSVDRFIPLGDFNKSVDYLPSSLSTLFLGTAFSHPLYHLPKSLSGLVLDDDDDVKITYGNSLDYLPDNITNLRIKKLIDPTQNTITRLPPQLTKFTIGFADNKDQHITHFCSWWEHYIAGRVPQQLQKLIILVPPDSSHTTISVTNKIGSSLPIGCEVELEVYNQE